MKERGVLLKKANQALLNLNEDPEIHRRLLGPIQEDSESNTAEIDLSKSRSARSGFMPGVLLSRWRQLAQRNATSLFNKMSLVSPNKKKHKIL